MERAHAKSGLRRYGPAALVAACMLAFFGLGLHRWISLEALRTHQAELQDLVVRHRAAAALGYVLAYAALVALSVPGGLVLTVTGGFLFGALGGGALAVVGATIGASLLFLIARSAFGDVLLRRTGGTVARLARGFRRDAFSYLLVLRLVPLFPFFAVNLAPALAGVRLRTFVGATAVGIVPATFIYASVGAGLGGLLEAGEDLTPAAILRPEILVALIGLSLLALAPVLYRRLAGAPAPQAEP
ncbi:MAG TPA: VTT domain-containing protein [Beijerinckiaceae bacterium]|nr:VTT domain-containing protein [Beijerinckiaceae bacterium]